MKPKCFAYVVGILGCFLVVLSVRAVVKINPDIIVKGTTIEVVGPGPDIQEIIDGITDAALDKPYLIKLGAGEYTITPHPTTSEGLVMAPHISIMGSGPGVTILKGGVSSGGVSATSAIISGASDMALTDLSVENTGGGTYSMAILNIDANPRIERVSAIALGATNNYSVYNRNSSSPIMTQVSAIAEGSGTENIGVLNTSLSSPTMTQVTASASDGINNYGVYNIDTSVTMVQVTAKGSGGTASYGVYNHDNVPNPRIEYSSLEGGTDGMRFGGSTGTRISYSRIQGGIDADPTGVQCLGNYDAALTPVTC